MKYQMSVVCGFLGLTLVAALLLAGWIAFLGGVIGLIVGLSLIAALEWARARDDAA